MPMTYPRTNPYSIAHGSVCPVIDESDGNPLYLTQDAYLAGTHATPEYRAHAVDVAGNDYMITWTPYDNYMDMDDESSCCDWDSYTITAL